jgi:teichuronic acid biosynthesis glycosyltransferase TuaC
VNPKLAEHVRVLIVSNMYPSAARPELGSFVRDQVEALRRIPEVELELFSFAPGGAVAYPRAAARLASHRLGRREPFDIVHAHFGLTLWPALAAGARARAVTLHGTDLAHPRSRRITLAGLRFIDLIGVVSEALARDLSPGAAAGARVAVLPCGVDTRRFAPIERRQARTALGLDPDSPYLLFPADPARPEKRHDLARSLADRQRMQLLTLGHVPPGQVPLWVNAANAVLVPSDREGFGLAVLEALACDVPVLATPVGIHAQALTGVPGTYCGPFDQQRWDQALAPHLLAADPRVAGRDRAQEFSTDRMAARLVDAWRELL